MGNHFDCAPNYGPPSTVGLNIDSVFQSDITNDNNTVNQTTWDQFAFVFTAVNTSTTIQFVNHTAIGDDMRGLDNVSLDLAAPEPGTLGVVFATVAAIGFRIRKL